MIEWYNSLPSLIQVISIIALIGTIIMVIQIIVMIIGFDSDSTFDDVDVSCDIDNVDDVVNDSSIFEIFGLKLLTFRNIIVFLSIGGWSLVFVYDQSKNYPLSILIGLIVGIAMMFLNAFIMKKLMLLQSNGNVEYKNAEGKIATVYLTIPPKKSGMGKINVLVQERFTEMDAMTNDEECIKTGSEVVIVDSFENYVIVERK